MADDTLAPVAFLPGPLICGDCGGMFICTKRTWTMECANPNCSNYGKQWYWPSVTLELANE